MTIYRQYRPHRFEDLLGQSSVVTLLQNALAQGRLAHAYLFSGPRGTGKTSTARLLAQAATCLTPKTATDSKGTTMYEACGTCEACLAFVEGRAQDIVEIDAASNRGIEDIRELRDQVAYPPLFLRYKMYIIDEVHMLTPEAFNALLKTLEEPTPQTIFVLATTELHKVPATIRSRCQLIRFQSGTAEALQDKLAHIVEGEKWTVEPEALTLIAEHANGGFRDAETLLEQLATQFSPLTAQDVQSQLGSLANTVVQALVTSVLGGDRPAVELQLRAISQDPTVRYEQVLTQLLQETRNHIDDRGIKSGLVGYALNQLLEAFILQRSSPVPALPLEIACLNIVDSVGASPRPTSIAQHVAVHEKPVEKTVEQPSIVPAVEKPQQPHVIVVPDVLPQESVPIVEIQDKAITNVRQAWKEMILEVGRTNAPLSQMLRETIFHTIEGNVITIHVRFKFHVEKLMEKKNKIRIEEILQNLSGGVWFVNYIIGENMPKRASHKELNPGSSSASDAAAVFGS